MRPLPRTTGPIVLRTWFGDADAWRSVCDGIRRPAEFLLIHQPGRSFRVIVPELWGVENNLSLANMDFEEFADNCDADGVFRGF